MYQDVLRFARVSPQLNGITISVTGNWTEPVGFQGGTSKWVQVTDGVTRNVTYLGQVHTFSSTGELDLDDPYPYGFYDSNGLASYSVDSPGQGTNGTLVTTADSYKTYILYTPKDGGIDVPLKVVSWGWNGTAVPGTPTWLVTAPVPAVNPSFPVAIGDCHAAGDCPTWTRIAQHFDVKIVTAALPNATVNQSYSAAISATDGFTPYQWTLLYGSLPPGLVLNDNVISGTPTTAGSYVFRVLAADVISNTQDGREFTIVVSQ